MDNVELYVPLKAEVKYVNVCLLPKTVLRKIKLHHSVNCTTIGKDSTFSMATCIFPVVVRRKGHPSTNQPVATDINCTALLAAVESKTVESPIPMPIVTSSSTAFKVLAEFFSSNSTEDLSPTNIPKNPNSFPPYCMQDAIIIFRGQVYLSLKKRKLHNQEKDALSFTPQNSPAPSLPQALRPFPKLTIERSQTDRALLHRFGLNQSLLVSLTKIPPHVLKTSLAERQPGGRRAKDHCLGQGGSKDARDCFSAGPRRWRVGRDARSEEREAASDVARTAASDGVGDQLCTSGRVEETGVPESCSDADVGEAGSGGASTGTTSSHEPLPACISVQGEGQGHREDFDFELLAREEAISRIRAQLREREAALSDVRYDNRRV